MTASGQPNPTYVGVLACFRNVLVHNYFDLEVVWSVVDQDLPRLVTAVHRMRWQGLADPTRGKGVPSPETYRQVTAERIDALARKWLRRLPHPFSPQDRLAGLLYHLSVLQGEFSLTQVFDRPMQGRLFDEEVIRENLDIGRPDHVQLVFERRVTKRTPSRFRTRVITNGVDPSLHFDYNNTRLSISMKGALRTETTINDSFDFGAGRRLGNLEDLKKIGFQANRCLLRVERLSHDCTLGAERVEQLNAAAQIGGQREPSLRFGDRRVQALLGALAAFRLLPRGFTARRWLRASGGRKLMAAEGR